MAVHLHRWGKGPPLIFLHGWTMAGDVWQPVARRLSATSLAPDLPAHGATTGYAPGIDGGVALLADLIRDEGLNGATLVGWSMGALIGWRYLAQGGRGIARMVSIDMSPRPLPAPDWPYAMRGQSAQKAARGAQRFRTDWPAAARAIAQSMFATTGGSPRFSADEAERRILLNPAPAMADCWESLTRADLRDAVRALPVPLLALHGAQSRVYPPQTGHWLAKAAPMGQALILPGCGHSPVLEDPAAVARAIVGFIESTAP